MDNNYIEIKDGDKTVRISFDPGSILYNRLGPKYELESLIYKALHVYYAKDHEKYRIKFYDVFSKYKFLLAHADTETLQKMKDEFEK